MVQLNKLTFTEEGDVTVMGLEGGVAIGGEATQNDDDEGAAVAVAVAVASRRAGDIIEEVARDDTPNPTWLGVEQLAAVVPAAAAAGVIVVVCVAVKVGVSGTLTLCSHPANCN